MFDSQWRCGMSEVSATNAIPQTHDLDDKQPPNRAARKSVRLRGLYRLARQRQSYPIALSDRRKASSDVYPGSISGAISATFPSLSPGPCAGFRVHHQAPRPSRGIRYRRPKGVAWSPPLASLSWRWLPQLQKPKTQGAILPSPAKPNGAVSAVSAASAFPSEPLRPLW